jgi:cytochrome d ubiquinol oxidase subunit I
MVLAAYISVAFVVGAVGAWHLLRDNANQAARTMFSMAMWMAVLVTPIQIVAGDQHGLNTLDHQPAKVAAMEGDWDTPGPQDGEPLVLFAIPDMEKQQNRAALEIPHLGSLVLTHSWNGVIKGLKSWPRTDIPPVPYVFFAFRIMVALGFLMFAVGLLGLLLRLRGRLYDNRWLHRIMLLMGPAGFVALLSGWTVTETGRQPYTVYGLLRTAESASPIGVPGVAISLLAFVIVYMIVYGSGITYIVRLMAKPPVPGESGPPKTPTRTAGINPGPAGATEDYPPAPAE